VNLLPTIIEFTLFVTILITEPNRRTKGWLEEKYLLRSQVLRAIEITLRSTWARVAQIVNSTAIHLSDVASQVVSLRDLITHSNYSLRPVEM
jgi:hypothetical protein